MILSSAGVLAKGTSVLDATFHDYRNDEYFADVQFENCTFSRNIRIAGSTFENCIFFNCSFNCDFFGCKFINCKFTGCEFWQLSMTNILLESSEMVSCDFQYCFLWAWRGGTMSDCAMFFSKFLCVETKLTNCQLEYVSINDSEPDDN